MCAAKLSFEGGVLLGAEVAPNLAREALRVFYARAGSAKPKAEASKGEAAKAAKAALAPDIQVKYSLFLMVACAFSFAAIARP